MLRTTSPYFFVFLLVLISNVLIAQVPAAPSGSTTWTRIEESSDWNTCGNCGNTSGTGSTATYSMERGITSPNVDGSATKFSIGGSYPFKNAYWFNKHYSGTPSTPLVYLKYQFSIYISAAYERAPQAIEFECQQKAQGHLYNFAWQADYASHMWRTYNFAMKRWESSGVSFADLSPGKWHTIVAEFHTANKEAIHDAITVDGVRHVVNIHHPARVWNSGHYLSNAFQLDLNGSATDYHVYVDAMKVTFK